MFSRSRKAKGSANDQRRTHEAHLTNLSELGLLGPGLIPPRSGGGGGWGKEIERPTYTSSTVRSFNNGASLPEKNVSIAGGTLRAPSHRSSPSTGSIKSRESSSRAGSSTGIMNSDRTRSRRERTFVGSECAVCEEPLEHTLRGERILQFSCTHVSHEACFYEFIREFESQYCPTCNAPLHLDTSRGGNVLDIGKDMDRLLPPSRQNDGADANGEPEKISSMVRSVSVQDSRSQGTPTPTQPWDDQAARPPSRGSNQRQGAGGMGMGRDMGRDMGREMGMGGGHPNYQPNNSYQPNNNYQQNNYQQNGGPPARGTLRDSRDTGPMSDRYTTPSRHARSDSEATGVASSGGYPETTQSGPPRRHDYDVQAMETSLASPRGHMTRNPIPAPTVTVRSEFPTISRSRQQQTLTCLVTVEVPDIKWRPDPEDLQNGPPMMPPQSVRADEGAFAMRPSSPARSAPRFYPYESPEVLAEMTENLRNRVDNWHGLDFSRFGKLRLYGTLRVGKDKVSWQELECFLFAEMLICVKEKKNAQPAATQWGDDDSVPRKSTRCTLKGSILIKKHLNEVSESGTVDENVLTLSLSVAELPHFHLRFENRNQLKLWQQALLDLNAVETSPVRSPDYDRGDFSETDEDDWQQRTPSSSRPQRVSSLGSSWGGAKSATTAPTEYTNFARSPLQQSVHVPVDVVVVVPISASMQGVKINLVRDALRFMVHTLGERDRMGLVTFGSSGGGVPIVGMTTKAWSGWSNVLNSIKPVGQKSHRADVVEGANVAMDLLMGRKYNNPIATIMLISDASTSDADSVDFVVSRAEAAKYVFSHNDFQLNDAKSSRITIHSFGLGMTHKPDTMIELSTRTKASYTYVKDWMMLRECLAGCLGAMQTLSHQNVKLKLKLPEGSPAKFHKISGALQITKRATGRDAEAALGDLRFGDKRDILVQLVIMPDNTSQEQLPQDPWDNIVSGLEALGGPVDQDELQRTVSVEEVPLIQADLSWGDILRDGTVQHTRPSLLAITMLPASSRNKSWTSSSPPIPPHPHIVQRRMELLTSDMLTRALTLVSRGQHDRAHTLLNETRSILKGLGKGGLPPVPPSGALPPVPSSSKSQPSTPHPANDTSSPTVSISTPDRKHSPSPTRASSSSVTGVNQPQGIPRSRSNDGLSAFGNGGTVAAGIDANTVAALDAELESSLEWINHPAVFGRDSRKAVLQAIGVISSQRAFTFRTPIESLWAGRVSGVKKLTGKSREWREEGGGEGGIMEEA
ncbi:protein STE5 [Diplogelasinospora grovesii]|uniref:Protein STE5 n=1 Tax=Diplogelasinospora grovesii TaxID=303347 RepID=A0AAN6N1W5_9PEZI|nr:protein STE5 [Diplogelasinospora grovesii]